MGFLEVDGRNPHFTVNTVFAEDSQDRRFSMIIYFTRPDHSFPGSRHAVRDSMVLREDVVDSMDPAARQSSPLSVPISAAVVRCHCTSLCVDPVVLPYDCSLQKRRYFIRSGGVPYYRVGGLPGYLGRIRLG